MSKSDEKRERLEKAYKVASRHYQRCLADLAEAKYNESNANYALLINGGSEWEDIADKRHVKAENKRKKIEERFKRYESIHLSALIRLQDYMESIGEPVA